MQNKSKKKEQKKTKKNIIYIFKEAENKEGERNGMC